jgi:hypothetical protein
MRKIALTGALLALIPLAASLAASGNEKPAKQKTAQTSRTSGCCGGCCAKTPAH